MKSEEHLISFGLSHTFSQTFYNLKEHVHRAAVCRVQACGTDAQHAIKMGPVVNTHCTPK